MASVDASRMAERRAAERDLIIPPIVNPSRREACEADDCLWLRTYCEDVFYNPFTPHQERIISDCGESLAYGTKKCKAAPRGDGKSSIVKYLAMKYALCRQVFFPLIVGATGEKAKDSLDSLKRRLASGARFDTRTRTFKLITTIGEDYPLECCTAAYVDPWPSRARNVTANGQQRIYVEWAANSIILPTWEDQEPLGPILMALGITSDELQGCNVYDRRPDFVMLDDLDSRDSLASTDGKVAGKIIEVVDKTIAGMAGQNRGLGQFMLCTITSRDAAAFQYSDTITKPAWSGERIPAIIEWPERKDHWQVYVELRQWGKSTLDDDKRPVDVHGRKAHQYLVEHFDEMHGGAVLSNPHNYKRTTLPDGSQEHLSALQRCYDFIADNNMAAFLTEYQNDPPIEEGATESGINVRLIQTQVCGFAQGEIPEGCIVLVHGVDVGKWKLHWVVRAFMPDGTGFTIDYGYDQVYDTKYKSEEGLDRAIQKAILQRMALFRDMPYAQQFRESLTLVDSGYRTEAVYSACVQAGLGVMPIKGIGLSEGTAERARFRDVLTRTPDRQPVCDGAYTSKQKLFVNGQETVSFKLVCADADQWKAWEHDRWQTAIDKPGCMFLWGEKPDRAEVMSADQRAHGNYANQICAEVETDDTGKRKWTLKSKHNHWLDASYYADVAAAIKGVRVLSGTAPKAASSPVKFSEIQAAKRQQRSG